MAAVVPATAVVVEPARAAMLDVTGSDVVKKVHELANDATRVISVVLTNIIGVCVCGV